MVKIHRLVRPNKHSGFLLKPGATTTVKNFVITNKNNFAVFVDKFTRKKWNPKKVKAKTK